MDQNISCTDADDSNISRNGLVCQYQFEDGSSQFILFRTVKESQAIRIDQSLSFCTENYVQLISSCNGLLLLCSIGEHEVKYHVFNPMSKQFFTLPQQVLTRQIVRSGLAYDGTHYQVVLVHVPDKQQDDKGVEIEIFSSETGKWRRYCPPNLFLPNPLQDFEFSELRTPPLFCNGAIHWEIGGHLLVYRVNDDGCEWIELPNSSDDWCWQFPMSYKRYLCESQGRIHYSYTDFEGVHTWILLNEHDHEYYSYYNVYNRQKFRWALAHSFSPEHLKFKDDEVYFNRRRSHWEPYDVSPLGSFADSETTYLKLPGSLVSHNTRTGVVEQICTYKFHGENFNCCSFLPFLLSSPVHPEMETERLEVGLPDLPITEELDEFSF